MKCKARILLGRQCKRNTKKGSRYCHQHQDYYRKRAWHIFRIVASWIGIVGSIASIVALIIVFFSSSEPYDIQNTLEEILELPASEYISYDNRLRKLAKERSVSAQQLKDEIDKWIDMVKTPYEKGLAALYHRKYKEAENYLKESAKSSEDRLSEIYIYLGGAQTGNQDYNKAISSYKQAIGLDPDDAASYLSLGIVYGLQSKHNEAIDSFKTAIRHKPDFVEAYINLGSTYSRQGKHNEAISCLKTAIRHDPDDLLYTVYINLGSAYSRQSEYDKSVDAYKQAIRLRPDMAIIYTALGATYYWQGKYEEAIDSHKQAIRLDPINGMAHCNLGWTYKAQGNYDEAVSSFKTAILLMPDFARSYIGLGQAYVGQHNFDEAVGVYIKAMQIYPYDIGIYYSLASAYLALERYEEAIDSFKIAITLEPDRMRKSDIYERIGALYLFIGKSTLAIDCFSKSKENRTTPKANQRIDQTGNQDYSKAISSYEQAIRLNPKDTMAYISLGAIYITQDKFDEAIGSLQKAIQLDSSNADAHTNLACAYLDQGEFDKAISSLKTAISLDPNHSNAHYNLGLVYMKQGKLDEATELFMRTIELDPSITNKIGVYSNLGGIYLFKGQLGPAAGYLEEADKINVNSQPHQFIIQSRVKVKES